MSSTPRSIRRSRASPRHRLPDVRPGPGGGADRRCPACPGLSRPVVVVAGVGRPGPPALRRPRRVDRCPGRRVRLVRDGRLRAGEPILALAECGATAGRVRGGGRCSVVSMGVGGASAPLRAHHCATGANRGRCTPLGLGDRRGCAVVAPPRRTVGIARCVAVESAGDARACVNRRRVAGELPGGRGQHRGRGSDPAALLARGCTAPHPRGPRPCMVLVESGAAARADGSDRARPAR